MKKEYETPTIIEILPITRVDLLFESNPAGENGVDTPGGKDSGIGL